MADGSLMTSMKWPLPVIEIPRTLHDIADVRDLSEIYILPHNFDTWLDRLEGFMRRQMSAHSHKSTPSSDEIESLSVET